MKVYVTGTGVMSSLGNSVPQMFSNLLEGQSTIRRMEDWSKLQGLHSHLGAPVFPYDITKLPRQVRRTMSPMSEMATLASMQALEEAKLNIKELDFSRSLLAIGSTNGSPKTMEDYFFKLKDNGGVQSQSSTSFFKVMNHSVASNAAVALGFNGAVLSPSSACATSAMSCILAWELIQAGIYDVAICGGADELHYLTAAVFDGVYAATRNYNHDPDKSPRPFDKERDGLVVSEGAGIVILESEAHMRKRNAKPLVEFCGGSYLCESSHMSQNNENQMLNVMNLAIQRSGLKTEDIDYISAHATGTIQGDAAESSAIRKLFGDKTPVSSLKGHFGHSMAACGVIELIATYLMQKEKILIGTRNLQNIAPECQGVYHLQENLKKDTHVALSNNFAFGGINTSFVIKRVSL